MPMTTRTKTLCACAATLILAIVAAVAPAIAQFPAAPDDAAAGGAKGNKGAAGASPTINGNWAGELTQVRKRLVPLVLEALAFSALCL